MNQISTKTKTFYYMEVSQEVYDRLRDGCKILDQMFCGNLEALQKMAFDAYKRRTGIDVPPDMQHNIIDCIKGLSAWGWNRPIENPLRMGEESDIYRDIYQTLDHQQKILGKSNESDGEPSHYCKTIPLPRILDVLNVTQKRKKPLKTFCDGYSKRRRI